jgi:hypothetical protein
MTVLQIVKGLIGEEDVNFGDSDTTFTRQTHTGGSTTIHYIDTKSIPSNALGGVVDNWLHVQHTDLGTTSAAFIINNAASEYLALSSGGQTTGVTMTFPTSSQALVGATDLASTAASKGASTVGVRDSAGNLTATNVEDALAELAVSVAGQTEFMGYKRGFTLGYSSTSAITLTGGMWEHRGTTTQNVYTLTQITFTLGSAGSNAGSTNLGASEMHYIYIDDSAVVTAGTALLTASEFVNTTTAPTWSNAKSGWYNGSDRCIGAILTDAASEIVDFFVRSDGFYAYTPTTSITEFASAAAPTTTTDLDLSSSMPKFSTKALLFIYPATAGTAYSFAIKGADNYSTFYTCSHNNALDVVEVYTDTSQVISWKGSAGSTTALNMHGYYIDEL